LLVCQAGLRIIKGKINTGRLLFINFLENGVIAKLSGNGFEYPNEKFEQEAPQIFVRRIVFRIALEEFGFHVKG
jgi:hypothetical protein